MNRKKFWRHYFIFLIIASLLLVGVLILLWIFLLSYEKGRPDYLAKEVLTLYEKGSKNKIISYVDEDLYSSSVIENYFNNLSLNKMSFNKKSGDYTSLKPVYEIKDSDNVVAILSLKPALKKGLFNTARWDIDSISLLVNKNEIKIVVPVNIDVFIDGKKLDDSYSTNYYGDYFNNLQDFIEPFKLYKYDSYIEGMDITLSKGTVILSDDLYVYKFDENNVLLNELSSLIKNICVNYTKYVVNETTFSSISANVLPNSNIYTILKNISNTNKWSGYHDNTIFSDIVLDNMKVINENVFSVNAKYSYSFNTDDGHKDYDVELVIVMVKSGNRWLIGNLITK